MSTDATRGLLDIDVGATFGIAKIVLRDGLDTQSEIDQSTPEKNANETFLIPSPPPA